MKKALFLSAMLAIAGAFGASLIPVDVPQQAEQTPAPKLPPAPPKPEPKPKPRRPWGPDCMAAVSGLRRPLFPRPNHPDIPLTRDGSTHAGHSVQADLPADQLVPNCGGADGQGLCVFTSIMFAARLQNVPQLKDFQTWMKRRPGGGYPQKVDETIAAICREHNQPIPDYIQIENGDWQLITTALKTGRMPAIMYGPDHMVNIVKLENGVGAFRDNNFVGEKEIAWMSADEAKRAACGSHFWAVILLAPRPPMPPRGNAVASAPHVAGDYDWRPTLPLEWALFRDGKQVGAYSAESDCYGALDRGQWLEFYRRPPVPLPDGAYSHLAGKVSGGVTFQGESAPRYTRNGVVITREDAMKALLAADGSLRPSLTVIGTDAELTAFRAEYVKPENADLASRFVFQAYTPDDWVINAGRYGFAHDGNPTIYLQKPDGSVLLRLRGMAADAVQQLRRKDPDYIPANDPGIKSEPAPEQIAGFGGMLFSALFGGLASIITLVFLRKCE